MAANPGFSPKHAAPVSADYQFPLMSFGTLRAYVDANYSGGNYTSSLTFRHPSCTLLNGRLTLGDLKLPGAGGEMEIALWGRNLADEEYILYGAELNTPGLVNTLDVWYGDPRTYGLELS